MSLMQKATKYVNSERNDLQALLEDAERRRADRSLPLEKRKQAEEEVGHYRRRLEALPLVGWTRGKSPD